MEMKKNHIKKMAQLRYRVLIQEMHQQGMSIREITRKINIRLQKSKLHKTTLSRDTIHKLVKGKFNA